VVSSEKHFQLVSPGLSFTLSFHLSPLISPFKRHRSLRWTLTKSSITTSMILTRLWLLALSPYGCITTLSSSTWMVQWQKESNWRKIGFKVLVHQLMLVSAVSFWVVLSQGLIDCMIRPILLWLSLCLFFTLLKIVIYF